MGKTMNIYGKMIDDQTTWGKINKLYRETKPSTPNCAELEEWVRNLLSNVSKDFYLYIHKTRSVNIYPIINKGLKIYEKGGALESTMSRIFDSASVDIEGDINYFLNIINTGNQYGNCSIVALIPRDYKEIYDLLHRSSLPTVPSDVIAFGVNEYKYVIPGNLYVLGIQQNKSNIAKK